MKRLTVTLSLSLALTLSQLCAADHVTVKEVFFTTDQTRENIDSPAVWHGPEGQHLLLATSKAGHSVNVFDAENGAMIRRVGGQGIELGQFNRPNGIWVIDHLALVVERDNRRVQVLQLPEMTPLLSFGEEQLRKPYGLYVKKASAGEYKVYVTDNYETKTEEIPADADLNQRVHCYTLELEGTTADAEWESAFGATEGLGRLLVVESINGDPAHGNLLIAEELEDDTVGRQVKVYDFDGQFTGRTIGQGIFKAQVEGIALYPTSETEGYWIITDQSKIANRFHLFERTTLEYLGSFKGERTLNTDGVWVTNKPMHRLPLGAFYACDNDRAVAAFDIAEILEAFKLK